MIEFLKFLGWCVVIIIAILLICVAIYYIVDTIKMSKELKRKSDAHMTFKQIKDLLFVNESRWLIETNKYWQIETLRYNSRCNYSISVSLIDYIRLNRFIKNLEKQKDKLEKNKTLETILCTAQKDIDARYAESNVYINDAKTIMQNINLQRRNY